MIEIERSSYLSSSYLTGALKSSDVDIGQLFLIERADIDLEGHSHQEWVVVTKKDLMIFDPKKGMPPRFRIKIDEIRDSRIQTGVGSALFQVLLHDGWLDLARFSLRLRHNFDRLQTRLTHLRTRGLEGTTEMIEEFDSPNCPRCGLMLENPGEPCIRCINQKSALLKVAQLMKPYQGHILILIGLLLITIVLDMAWPLLTKFLVDNVLSTTRSQLSGQLIFLNNWSAEELLVGVVLALAGVHIVRGALSLVSGIIGGRVSNSLTFDVRAQLVMKLEQLGLSFYSKQETGSLVGRVAYDTESIQSFISQITSGFIMQILLVIFSFLMMFSLQPRLALWALVPAPFVLGGAFVYWRFVHPPFQRYWYRTSKQAAVLNGLLSGIRVVKAFGQEDREFGRFQNTSADVRASKNQLDRISAFFYPLMGIIFQVGGWIIWYVGGRSVLGEHLSLGTLMAFFGYLSLFYGPLGSLTNLTTWLTQFATQVFRIFEILDTPTVIPEAQNPVSLQRAHGDIEFSHVSFGYARGVPVLRDLSFSIRRGERIGIVGPSGSGKTSMINLITRFYDVDEGSIHIDGIDVRNIRQHDLRSQVSLVLQEPFLFHGTLYENIRYGRPDATLEDVIRVTRLANAHDLIMQKPLAYDTSVGERGSELSGGERQRISIARALLYDTPILVLDEATSSIDSESELAIQMALEQVAHDRTTLIIAHRLSTVKACDRILVIEYGQLIEQGSHNELMSKNGRYARWVKIQQGQNEEQKNTESIRHDHGRAPSLPLAMWIEPTEDILSWSERFGLRVKTVDGKVHDGAYVVRCFPVEHQYEYLSLCIPSASGRSTEIGLIRDLRQWPKGAQEALLNALHRRYFFHTIRRLRAIKSHAQLLAFQVQTQGERMEFILRPSPETVLHFGPKGRLLMDIEGSLYVIPDLARLRASERALFRRHIYW